MIVTLIAAVSDDGFISRDRGIPWHLPDDIAHFRQSTTGKHLLLGRVTAQEMAGWFRDHHTPLILSRASICEVPPGGRVVHSVNEAIQASSAAGSLMVCGGAEVYAAALPFATHLLLTHVHTALGAGRSFPRFTPSEWVTVPRLHHPADARHAHPFSIVEYRRKDPPQDSPCKKIDSQLGIHTDSRLFFYPA